MTDDLVKRVLARADFLEGYSADRKTVELLREVANRWAFRTALDEAATRLSAQPAEVEAVEVVARARSHELVAFGRQKATTLASTLRFAAESDEQKMRTTALLEAASRIEELTTHLEAALAVRPSGAEMRERAAKLVEDFGPATQDMTSTYICDALDRAAAAIRNRSALENSNG